MNPEWANDLMVVWLERSWTVRHPMCRHRRRRTDHGMPETTAVYCPACKVVKPRACFRLMRNAKTGIRTRCIDCEWPNPNHRKAS